MTLRQRLSQGSKTDYIVRVGQLWLAHARRRNPPIPPWRKRELGLWHTDRPEVGPSEPSVRSTPLILGVTAVWNEDDVIWATVRNLFAQGADDVFVIDDESSDDTVSEARAAGATVIAQSSSGVYSEDNRHTRMRRIITEQTNLAGGDVWWIMVDADEFPRGPNGVTIRELIEDLPAWVDVVGSRTLEHFPDATSVFRPRTHPVQSMPLALWHYCPYCTRDHWKHQLFRVRNVDDLYPLPGHHIIGTADGRLVREAGPTLLMHHVPLRDRTRTEAKLRAAGASGGRYEKAPEKSPKERLAYRVSILDDLYNNRFDVVRNEFAGAPAVGLPLRNWRDLVPEAEQVLPEID